jgi:hypothetical protein
MKKILLILCILILGLPAAFANDDSVNAQLNKSLHLLFKLTDESNMVNATNYQQRSFVYKGIEVTAFKNETTGWIGFFKKLSVDDLPTNAVASIQHKYKGCKIENVTIYFNNDAAVSYFAEIVTNNKYILLKVQPSGKIKVFS